MRHLRPSAIAAFAASLIALLALPSFSPVVRSVLAAADPVPRTSAAGFSSGYQIGAFYFPVWNEQMAAPFVKNTEMLYGRSGDPFGGIKDHLTSTGPWGYGPFPEREPLIGWYDDREQRVMDTHILQAASRGLGHFAFYYYWKDAGGGEKPAQSVRRFQSSAYKDLMNFYIYMVASGSWPTSDWDSRIVPALVDFMRDPSYQRNPEGRPVIGFYGDFASRLGGREAWSRALKALRSQARAAGLADPLILVSGSSSPAADEALGADGFLPLNYAGTGLTADTGPAASNGGYGGYGGSVRSGGGSTVADYSAYSTAWPAALGRFAGHLLIPGGLSGFDPRPWRGIGYGDTPAVGNVAYANPSPAKFRKQLETVKQYLDRHPASGNMATFYAWNEWGEGGAIEPSTLYGFGYLNALQDVFGLSNATYAARAARDRLASLDPPLRLEAAPEPAVMAAGQPFTVTVRATNRGGTPLSGLAPRLDAAGWAVRPSGSAGSGGSTGSSGSSSSNSSSSSGASGASGASGGSVTADAEKQPAATTAFTLAPGETRLFTYSVEVGAGADYTKHPLTVRADYSAGAAAGSGSASGSTFVVKSPPVSAALERVGRAVQPGETVPLTLRLTNRLAAAQAGKYRVEAPAGWTVTAADGAYAFTGGSEPRSAEEQLSVTIPRGTASGVYELRWTLTAAGGGPETAGTLQLRVSNALQNPGFELPVATGSPEAPAPYWFALTGKETLTAAAGRDGRGNAERIAADGSGHGIGQEWIDLLPDRSYTVEAWIKVETGALAITEMDVDSGFRTNLGFPLRETVAAGDWRKYSFTVRPKPGAAKASLRFLTASEGHTVAYIDDVVYRPAE